MKQFNLKEYLKNPNQKLITRDGRKVRRILCTDRRDEEFPIVALIEDGNRDDVLTYTKDGKWNLSDGVNKNDLFFAPEKKEGWINIYRGKDYPCAGLVIYDSEEDAEEASKHCTGFTKDLHLATVKIEWEE